MRRHLGVGRVVAEGREEELAQAHPRRIRAAPARAHRSTGAAPTAADAPASLAAVPDGVTLLLIVVIVLAVVFDYINGFHDTANAIATSVSTRALKPDARDPHVGDRATSSAR